MKFKQFVAIAAFAVLGSVSNLAAASTTTSLGSLVSSNNGNSFGGGAASSPWANLGNGSSGSVSVDNFYTFTLNSGTTFNTVVSGWGGMTDITATFRDGITNAVIGSFTPTTSYNTVLTQNSISGHSSYSLQIQATAPSESAASYTFLLNSVAAVPEPETYALLLAGLGLIGLVTRRRNKLSVA